MNQFLIPANTKKSKLILGFFTLIDLIVFGTGCLITIILLFVFQSMSFQVALLVLLPAVIGAFLVAPVPNYHNVMQLLTNIILFVLNRKRYYWKGWCMYDGKK